MATNYLRGVLAALTVQWTEYTGGPATDVTGLTITITRVTGSVIVVGPTATGVTHVATGLELYNWASADDAALGDYAVVWAGLDSDGDAVQASEVITLVASTVTVTVESYTSYVGADAVSKWAVIGDDESVTYPEIEDAIAAETRAQRKRVTYPTDDVDGLADLTNALKRRVQRNLAMRALALALTPAGDGTMARPGGRDPEIRRLEAPYPKLVVG